MGLREEIEAAFSEAAAEGGVRALSIDGDDKVWVAGLGASDGSLEVGGRGCGAAAAARRDGAGLSRGLSMDPALAGASGGARRGAA